MGPPPWPDLVSISHSVTMGRCQTLRIFEGNVRRVFINAISYHGGTTKSDDVGNDACCGGVVQGRPEYHYPGAVLYIAKFAEEFLEHFDSEMSELRALLLYRKRNQVRNSISLIHFFVFFFSFWGWSSMDGVVVRDSVTGHLL